MHLTSTTSRRTLRTVGQTIARSAALPITSAAALLRPKPTRPGGATGSIIDCLLGIGLGLVAWLVLLLAIPNTVRNVFLYGLVNADGYETAWGGPTLAGAWLAHAAIAIALLPVYILVLRLILKLRTLTSQRFLENQKVPAWALPVTVTLTLFGALFALLLVRQL